MAPKKAASTSEPRKSTRESKQTATPTPKMSAVASSEPKKAKAKAAPKPKAKAKPATNKRKAAEQDPQEDEEEEDDDEEEEPTKKKKKAAPKKKAAKKSSLPTSNKPNENQLSEYNFVFTGKLPSLTRDQASKYAKDKGASISKLVTAATTHAVLGDEVGDKKMGEIEKRGLKTMTEAEFLDLVGVDLNADVEDDDEDDDEDKGEEEEEEEQDDAVGSTKKTSSKKEFKSVDVATLKKSKFTSLKGLRVLFTGTLDMDRKEAAALAVQEGAIIAKTVSGTTDLVVIGKQCGPKKMEEIEKKGIQIVDEDGFLKLVGRNADDKGEGGSGNQDEEDAEGDDDE